MTLYYIHTLLFKNEDVNYYLESTIWLNVDNIKIAAGQEDARKAYKETLEGHGLYETFNYIVGELEKYSMIILKEYKVSQN